MSVLYSLAGICALASSVLLSAMMSAVAQAPRDVSKRSATVWATGQPAQQVPKPAGNSVVVQDPTLGMVQGYLPLQPGWHGEAHIDRTTDPLAYALGTLTADLSSGDGSTKIHMLGVPFHTYGVSREMGMQLPGSPARQRNAALVRFTSTLQILKQYVLPALQFTGQPTQAESMPEATRAQLQARMAAQGGGRGPIFDTAYALFRRGNQDVVVYAVSFGSGAGSASEVTSTGISVYTAPQGKALPAMQAQQDLPPVQRSIAWQRADEQYAAAWREMIADEGRRTRDMINRQTQAIVAQGHANVAAMQARGAARDREFVQHEQLTSDLGANFRGYLSGTSTTFKWCGGSGSTMYTVDDVRPPAQGMRRCD